MKKLVLAIAVCIGLGSVSYASSLKNESNIELTQEKAYKKIKVSDVSKEAMDNIKKQYGDYKVTEAYVATDGEYKLVLSKDGIPLTATFTKQGSLVKIMA